MPKITPTISCIKILSPIILSKMINKKIWSTIENFDKSVITINRFLSVLLIIKLGFVSL